MEEGQLKISIMKKRWFWIWIVVSFLTVLPGISAEAGENRYLSREKELPRLSDWEYIMTEDWPEAPEIEAEAAVLLDADSGEVLYAKNADSQYYPASITKILTALITIEEGDLSDTLVFKGDALTPLPEGYVSINPTKGEKMLVEDCLYGMLLSSANDAANALAVYNAKKIKAFAKKMNARAAEAGATHTHFTNPSGLAEDTHYTTAYDMAMILRACVRYSEFLEIAGSTYHIIPATNKHEEREAKMRHEMLLEDSPNFYEYCVAGKTGFTTPAGRTLVTYAEKDGMRLVCCVLKCGDGEQYRSTRALFDYGFQQFRFVKGDRVDDSRVRLRFSKEILNRMQRDREFTLEKSESSTLLLPGGRSIGDLDVILRDLDPAENDGCFAQAVYCLGDRILGSSRLKFTVRDRSGEALSLLERNEKLQQLRQETEKTIQMCLAGIAGLLLLFIVLTVLLLRAGKRQRTAAVMDETFLETEGQREKGQISDGDLIPDPEAAEGLLLLNEEKTAAENTDPASENQDLPEKADDKNSDYAMTLKENSAIISDKKAAELTDTEIWEKMVYTDWEESDRKLQESLAHLLELKAAEGLTKENGEKSVSDKKTEEEASGKSVSDKKTEEEGSEKSVSDKKTEEDVSEKSVSNKESEEETDGKSVSDKMSEEETDGKSLSDKQSGEETKEELFPDKEEQ